MRHHDCRPAEERERRDEHAAVTDRNELRHTRPGLPFEQRDRVAIGRDRELRVARPGRLFAGGSAACGPFGHRRVRHGRFGWRGFLDAGHRPRSSHARLGPGRFVCRTVGWLGNPPARECLGTLGSTDSTKQERLRPRAHRPLKGAARMFTSRYAALIAALVLAVFAALQAGAEPAGAASSPQMHFDKYMTVQSVCFTVTNPDLGQSTLYGQRFTDGTVSPSTPAIVLVHGIASSTLNWDFSPTWSVARALAARGYVVYSYDRLGYAKSSYYDHPGGGYTLTTSAHRDELHDIVTEVKSGAYTTTSGSDCSGAQSPS